MSDNYLSCCLDVLVEQVAKYKEQFVQAVQEVDLHLFCIILHVTQFDVMLYCYSNQNTCIIVINYLVNCAYA